MKLSLGTEVKALISGFEYKIVGVNEYTMLDEYGVEDTTITYTLKDLDDGRLIKMSALDLYLNYNII